MLPRRLVKFTRCNVLTVFVESNQGDEDTTVVQKLAVFGSCECLRGLGRRGWEKDRRSVLLARPLPASGRPEGSDACYGPAVLRCRSWRHF